MPDRRSGDYKTVLRVRLSIRAMRTMASAAKSLVARRELQTAGWSALHRLHNLITSPFGTQGLSLSERNGR